MFLSDVGAACISARFSRSMAVQQRIDRIGHSESIQVASQKLVDGLATTSGGAMVAA
jgi:hypothetical protein